jgi:hypothetical protein
MTDLLDRWREAFYTTVRQSAYAIPLQQAALQGKMAWTRAITDVAVATCQGLGWEATARQHTLERLPVPRSEYLAIDVMAFAPGAERWPLPLAIIELENNQDDAYIAYNLWKLLCVRATLRLVYCYRPHADQGSALVQALSRDVIGGLPIADRLALDGETVIVIGSRADVATFPHGFFRWWRLDKNIGHFVRG